MNDKLESIKQSGLNENALISIVNSVKDKAIELYNAEYETDYNADNIPQELKDYVLAFAILSFYGWNEITEARLSNISQEIKNILVEIFPTDYEGIDKTTEKQLNKLYQDNNQNLTDEQINKLADSRAETITNGLFNIFQASLFLLANNDGREYVGALTMRDSRVRPDHKPNDNRYWKASTRHPFWFDYNCRCQYFWFASPEQAEAKGFTAF